MKKRWYHLDLYKAVLAIVIVLAISKPISSDAIDEKVINRQLLANIGDYSSEGVAVESLSTKMPLLVENDYPLRGGLNCTQSGIAVGDCTASVTNITKTYNLKFDFQILGRDVQGKEVLSEYESALLAPKESKTVSFKRPNDTNLELIIVGGRQTRVMPF